MKLYLTPYSDELYHYNKNHDAKGRFASGPGGAIGFVRKRKNDDRLNEYHVEDRPRLEYHRSSNGSSSSSGSYDDAIDVEWREVKEPSKKERKQQAKAAKYEYKKEKAETKAAKKSGDKAKYYEEKAEDEIAKQIYEDVKKGKSKDFNPYKSLKGYMSDGKYAVDNVINKYSDDNYVAKAQNDLKKWKHKDTQYIWEKANRMNAENSYLGAREKRAQYSGARRAGTRATTVILSAGTIAAGVYFGKKVLAKMKGK